MIRISKRDRQVIDYLITHRAERTGRLKEKFYSEIGIRAFNFQMKRLKDNLSELLDDTEVSFTDERIMVAKPIPGVVGTYPEHDLRVSDVVSAFEHCLSGNDFTVIREQQIREQKIWNAQTGKSYTYSKIPDAVILYGKIAISVELENSQKSYKRIYESVQKFESSRHTDIDYTLVCCVSSGIYRAYQKAVEEYLARSKKPVKESRVIVLNCHYMSFKNEYREILNNEIQQIIKEINKRRR